MADDGSKMEQFLVLMRTAKGSALGDVVSRAIAEPGLFVFGELVSLPSIQQVKGTAEEHVFRVMELFAYGTWMDYKGAQHARQSCQHGEHSAGPLTQPCCAGHPDSFMPLNDRQQKKLKQLTMCSLAQRRKVNASQLDRKGLTC